ncbi:surface-adhesin E family protein [Candidatus Accumulibacter contiguus]|jgi:hypothetical protein|uniref:surface-adhesin E family protein n=1 Tax=Candidatus Accumulibacter contiguus TaxID=2954381 RepID=UPI002FC312C3
MKNIILTLLAVVGSTAVNAEWSNIGSSQTGKGDVVTVYADFSTIRRNGDKAKIWSLWSTNLPQYIFDNNNRPVSGSGPFKSMKFQREFDCKEETSRVLFLQFKSGSMGDGESFGDITSEEKWMPASPGSIVSTLLNIACGKYR